MAEDYESMTVAQLKELLKEEGLPVSGKKSDLIARLQDAAGEADEVVEDEPLAEDAEDDDSWDDEDWDDETEDVYMVKQKPVLNDDMKAALALRAAQKKKTPSFRRTEWFRYKRLSRSGWRAPHGMDNKQRRNYKYRGSLVRIGHGKVAAARFLLGGCLQVGVQVHEGRVQALHDHHGLRKTIEASLEVRIQPLQILLPN